MRLGAEYSAAQIQVPVDHGQHWTAWLLEWARYSHDAFVAQPALLGQFLNGSLGVERMVHARRRGHRRADPSRVQPDGGRRRATRLVSDCALGAAVAEIRTVEVGARRPAGASPSTTGCSPCNHPTRCRTCGSSSSAHSPRGLHRARPDRARRHRGAARRTVAADRRAPRRLLARRSQRRLDASVEDDGVAGDGPEEDDVDGDGPAIGERRRCRHRRARRSRTAKRVASPTERGPPGRGGHRPRPGCARRRAHAPSRRCSARAARSTSSSSPKRRSRTCTPASSPSRAARFRRSPRSADRASAPG